MGQSKREIVNISDWSLEKKRHLLKEWYDVDCEELYDFQLEHEEVIGTDMSKQYRTYHVVLQRKSDGKYFATEFDYSYDWDTIDEVNELTQVLKKYRTEAYYE